MNFSFPRRGNKEPNGFGGKTIPFPPKRTFHLSPLFKNVGEGTFHNFRNFSISSMSEFPSSSLSLLQTSEPTSVDPRESKPASSRKSPLFLFFFFFISFFSFRFIFFHDMARANKLAKLVNSSESMRAFREKY
jgi:hypothetical protein